MTNTFTLDEFPGVTFSVLTGSGGVPGLPSNSVRIIATMPNPYFDPDHDYSQDPNGHNEVSDPWKRHTDLLEVIRTGFVGPTGLPADFPTDPPPQATPTEPAITE
ncbi:hypothetical protein SEA_RUTHY_23 [Gordonia phage Ruthy]|uniref:Uncharacterized protein n=1 Tax=Gordonia phage Ruthy TaxID=2250323 RepID=A0A345L5D4_9CAUD|nr:minor tail protein [Gordonia phage Ruthy]AXH50486.1 hypothetical protein SEA_RUTHY_23 [Gordonia phage Ruthy]